jgi:hypothetical protein
MTRLVALFLFVFLLAPSATEAGVRNLDIRASVKMLPGGGSSLMQAGTFIGAPLGSGKVRVRTFVGQGRGSVVRFEMWNSRGKIRGTGDCAVKFKGSLIIYSGTAKITAGTGAYRTMRGRGLRVSGRGTLSSERFTVRLSGRVRV